MNQQTADELFAMGSPEVSMVEDQAASSLLQKSMYQREEKLYAQARHVEQMHRPHQIKTPAGMEPIIQQTYSEKWVERDDVAERVVKSLSVTDVDEGSGRGTRITISEQQLDPDYGLSSDGRDVISLKETVSVTPSYTTTVKRVVHEVTSPKIQMDPAELSQLVEEEILDIENTLKIVPPDLVLQEDRYAVKRRLQKLRLNAESIMLLEESVVNPTPTADDAMTETPPEALATIMHTIESGVSPDCAPDQMFHSLFEEKATEQSVILSSVGPGPLQDVIVPQVLSKEIHKESMTPNLTGLTNIYKNVTDAKDWPPVDIFDSVMDAAAKSPNKERKTRPFKALEDEEMPWNDEDLEPLVNIVGAEPAVVLDQTKIEDIENLEKTLAQGIEYFVDADPVQYMSRVQLRGTQPPPWFPGYIYALPEFPDVVKLARNPDEVFIAGWRSCQPRIIPEHSFSILR
ncbi:unnamed protein product [Ceutorhynchus assimilis]|uniref:Uncharacterized protein n=1 Tax=Ceutorhynchus assimilis TaxID=467358 RepID=A0A9N9N1K7_9CUCU|nr:unnamed protein product [Ceutorhynchus assimilis]